MRTGNTAAAPGPDLRDSLLALFQSLDRMPGFAAITDRHGTIVHVSSAGRAMLDLGRGANPAGSSLLDHYTTQSRELMRGRVFPAARRNGAWFGETALVGSDGQPIPLWQVTLCHEGAGTDGGWFSTLAWDISSRKDLERNLWHQATHDALTGLPNRALLLDRLAQEIGNAHRSPHFTAVMLLDVDGFKEINDGYGHEAGDQLLTELAVRLYACVRAGDTVGRYGGDEFVFLLCGLNDAGEVDHVERRIRSALETPFHAGDHTFRVGASIGVAIHPDDGDDADALLAQADRKMYGAKALREPPGTRQLRLVPDSIGPTVNGAVDVTARNPL